MANEIICVFSGGIGACRERDVKIYFGMSLCDEHLKKVHALSGEGSVANTDWSHDMFEQVVEQDINQYMAHEKEQHTGLHKIIEREE